MKSTYQPIVRSVTVSKPFKKIYYFTKEGDKVEIFKNNRLVAVLSKEDLLEFLSPTKD